MSYKVLIIMILLIIFIKACKKFRLFEEFNYQDYTKIKGNYSYYNYSKDPDVNFFVLNKPYYFDKKTEFSPDKMNIILLETLQNNLYQGPIINNECAEESLELCHKLTEHNPRTLLKIRDWLLEQINKTLIKIDMNKLDIFSEKKKNINLGKFYIKNYSQEYKKSLFDYVFKTSKFLTSDTKILDYSKDLTIENYKFITRIYRKNKNNHFFIYCESIIDTQSDVIKLVKLEVNGILPKEDLTFNKMKETKYNLTNNYDLKPYCKINQNNDCFSKIILSKSEIEAIENQQFFNQQLKNNKSNYRCINKKADTREECLSKKNGILGIWDAPCKTDDDCPYYKKNKNYNNSFGGCIEGKCQMPINVKNLAFRIPSSTKPYCHNCVTEKKNYQASNCNGLNCNMCCKKQKNDTNLSSPDFAFENDFPKRQEDKKSLEAKGLKPFKLKL